MQNNIKSDLIIEQVLNKLLELARSEEMTEKTISDEKALEIVQSHFPNYTLVDKISVPGSTPLFVLQGSQLEEANRLSTGSEHYQEKKAFEQLKNFINEKTENGTNPITVTFKTESGNKKETFTNIIDVEYISSNLPGNPIADFVFLRKNEENAIDRLPPIYLSHKGGNKLTDFRQLSGISQMKRPKINAHKEVQKFKKLYEEWLKTNVEHTYSYVLSSSDLDKGRRELRSYYFDSQMPIKRLRSNIVVAKVIIDENLMRQAMHGQDTLQPERGLHAVDFLMQGSFKFQKLSKNHWEIIAPIVIPHTFEFKDLSPEKYPVLTIRPADKQDDEGFLFTRIGIYPFAGAHGEKNPHRAANKKVIWLAK